MSEKQGIEYLPQGGIDPNKLPKMLDTAKKRQKEAIANTGNVLQATGMFIDPQKITGLIQSDGEDKGGQFLNPNYIKNPVNSILFKFQIYFVSLFGKEIF